MKNTLICTITNPNFAVAVRDTLQQLAGKLGHKNNLAAMAKTLLLVALLILTISIMQSVNGSIRRPELLKTWDEFVSSIKKLGKIAVSEVKDVGSATGKWMKNTLRL